MKKWSIISTMILLAAALAGCSDNSNEAAPSASGSASSSPIASATASVAVGGDINLNISQTSFDLKQWEEDGSHNTTVQGKLVVGGSPVQNAVLHAGTSKKDIVTDESGSFQIIIDQSLLMDTEVKVVSLDNATIGGSPVDQSLSAELLKTSTFITVNYPIEVKDVQPSADDAGKVVVNARIKSQEGDVISFFQVDKYRIGGVVKDADGNPVKDAVVWIDRDEGEGFGKSTPTDENGTYQLFYLPESDEGTNLTVTIGTTRYTLPKGKVFHIPDDTSVLINITLPKEGTEIVDKPPTLEAITSNGAMYTGILAGLNVPSDVAYTVTIPDKEGNFTLTVDKAVWEQNPAFFETKLTKFVEDRDLTWGDTLESSFVQPGANDPKRISPISQGA
ncbi:carboxypeptidase-like regulatory domain-containing protein [Cohnella sp. AR92]|uniref:carboxypeptidase-like regulatory domain-containing protein n=1 Tax=Cohnella sp. AR92 TaxID=648716 RepID=UPI0013152AAB|nr:carboxypeptidase-like regulatory domain-containing protein [Cohnella sp. AR92]